MLIRGVLPMGERLPYSVIANLLENLGSNAEEYAEGPILPKNVNHPPHFILSISATNFDEVLAQPDLNNSC